MTKPIDDKKELFISIMIAILLIIPISIAVTGCSEAERKSTEISRDADNFETPRKLTIINTRNDKIILEFIGTFSVQTDHDEGEIDILCSIGDNRYEKHFFKINDWTTYVIEDMSNQGVEKYYREIKYYPENK
jgi:heme/copper-type cytochrome/quinol oxidase subunit 2